MTTKSDKLLELCGDTTDELSEVKVDKIELGLALSQTISKRVSKDLQAGARLVGRYAEDMANSFRSIKQKGEDTPDSTSLAKLDTLMEELKVFQRTVENYIEGAKRQATIIKS